MPDWHNQLQANTSLKSRQVKMPLDATPLCTDCRDLFHEILLGNASSGSNEWWRLDFHSFEQSARNGCPICHAIHRLIPAETARVMRNAKYPGIRFESSGLRVHPSQKSFDLSVSMRFWYQKDEAVDVPRYERPCRYIHSSSRLEVIICLVPGTYL